MESVACNSCYLFSKRLLQQCGEDVRSAEGSLEAKVIDPKERMHTCMTSGEHNEVALLKAALSRGGNVVRSCCNLGPFQRSTKSM